MLCRRISAGIISVVETSITLTINGETRAVPALCSVAELLQHLGIAQDGVAVEVNHRIVRRKDWSTTPVEDCDKVEIVQLVGGG